VLGDICVGDHSDASDALRMSSTFEAEPPSPNVRTDATGLKCVRFVLEVGLRFLSSDLRGLLVGLLMGLLVGLLMVSMRKLCEIVP
jgi:hypothetical protein